MASRYSAGRLLHALLPSAAPWPITASNLVAHEARREKVVSVLDADSECPLPRDPLEGEGREPGRITPRTISEFRSELLPQKVSMSLSSQAVRSLSSQLWRKDASGFVSREERRLA